MTYNSIKVVKGNGGYGGPLVITPTEENINLFYRWRRETRNC